MSFVIINIFVPHRTNSLLGIDKQAPTTFSSFEKIAWTDDLEMVLQEMRSHYDELLKRARSNGWEVEE